MSPETAYTDDLAHFFAEHATESSYNAYIDRPAVLGLVDNCAGQRVLDVGCGAGHYLAALSERGAHPVGIDGSPDLLAHAARRAGPDVELYEQDLENPLRFADGSFDGVVMALVYHHVTDRTQLLSELFRVLRPGGWLVLSTTHPTGDMRFFGNSYFADDQVDAPVAGGRFSIRYWRLTIEQLITEVLAVGFQLERLIEPRPIAEFESIDPAAYRRLQEMPSLLAIRLRRT